MASYNGYPIKFIIVMIIPLSQKNDFMNSEFRRHSNFIRKIRTLTLAETMSNSNWINSTLYRIRKHAKTTTNPSLLHSAYGTICRRRCDEPTLAQDLLDTHPSFFLIQEHNTDVANNPLEKKEEK